MSQGVGKRRLIVPTKENSTARRMVIDHCLLSIRSEEAGAYAELIMVIDHCLLSIRS